MIWVQDELVPDEELRISVLDRTFEHGLGLFETFRTWNGHPTLLNRHVERMQRSARELGLPLESGQLPDARAVSDLIEANRASLAPGQDVRLRLTLSGGAGDHAGLGLGPLDDGRAAAAPGPSTGRGHHAVHRSGRG